LEVFEFDVGEKKGTLSTTTHHCCSCRVAVVDDESTSYSTTTATDFIGGYSHHAIFEFVLSSNQYVFDYYSSANKLALACR